MKFSASLAFYLFSPTRLINSINMSTHVRSSIYIIFPNMVTSAGITKTEIEHKQLEVARIALGAFKLISINNFYKETGWNLWNNEGKT